MTKYRIMKNGLGEYKVQYQYGRLKIWDDYTETKMKEHSTDCSTLAVITILFETIEDAKKFINAKKEEEKNQILAQTWEEVVE